MVGGGPAGRALAAETGRRGLRTLLLDPAPDAPWRHTYGSWADELPAELPPSVVAARARGRAIARTEHRLGWEYAVLDVPALRAHLDAGLAAGGVAVRAGRAVGLAAAGTVALADGGELRARLVVDAGGGRQPWPGPGPAGGATGHGGAAPRPGRRPQPVDLGWRARPGRRRAGGLRRDRRRRRGRRAAGPGRGAVHGLAAGPRRTGPADLPLRRPAGRRRGAARGDLAGAPARPADAGAAPAAARPGWPGTASTRPARPTSGCCSGWTRRGTAGHRAGARVRRGGAAGAPGQRVQPGRRAHPGPADGRRARRRLPDGAPAALAAARAVLWPAPARAVHRLRRIGLEALLRMPPQRVPEFFEVFFALPEQHRWAT